MLTWQILLEFLKTLGLGSLLGVILGAGMNRRLKSREILQSIKSANYRETINAYEKFSVTVEKAVSAGVKAVSAGKVIVEVANSRSESKVAAVRKHFSAEVDGQMERLKEVSETLQEQVAKLGVHHSSSIICMTAQVVESNVGTLETDIRFLIYEPSAENLARAQDQLSLLKASVQTLNDVWGAWKIGAEQEAAGIRPAVWRRRVRALVRSRRSDRRAVQSSADEAGEV